MSPCPQVHQQPTHRKPTLPAPPRRQPRIPPQHLSTQAQQPRRLRPSSSTHQLPASQGPPVHRQISHGPTQVVQHTRTKSLKQNIQASYSKTPIHTFKEQFPHLRDRTSTLRDTPSPGSIPSSEHPTCRQETRVRSTSQHLAAGERAYTGHPKNSKGPILTPTEGRAMCLLQCSDLDFGALASSRAGGRNRVVPNRSSHPMPTA